MSRTPSMFTLTVRGNTLPKTPDARRTLHNESAGSAPGMAAARALSDISHQVFVPCAAAGERGGVAADELLFLDVWTNPAGLNDFFSNKNVQEQAGKLFGKRDGTLWAPAADGFTVSLLAPSSAKNLYLGMIRTAVPSVDAATQKFGEVGMKHLADARRRGLVSHQIFFKFVGPGAPAAELLGLDVWGNLDGMMEHYQSTMGDLSSAFAGKPDTSVWERAQGFNEW